MKTKTLRRLPLLVIAWLCSLLVSACTTTQLDAAEIAAERERFLSVRGTTEDGAVTPNERPSFDAMLAEWDARIAADERALVDQDARSVARDLLRAYGIATVQVFLVPELRLRAPELFRLVDRNGDDMLDENELLAIDPTNPVFAAVVVMTAVRLTKHT